VASRDARPARYERQLRHRAAYQPRTHGPIDAAHQRTLMRRFWVLLKELRCDAQNPAASGRQALVFTDGGFAPTFTYIRARGSLAGVRVSRILTAMLSAVFKRLILLLGTNGARRMNSALFNDIWRK